VAENAGLAGSEILSVVDAWGWTARVLLRKGKTTGEVIGKIPVLESNLGLRPGSMRVFADGKRAASNPALQTAGSAAAGNGDGFP
jgi:DNA segregation ATPase FtsK/SpoIIIE, S-DNA-T family